MTSSRWSAATRLSRQIATGLPSTRPRRHAGSHGRSQVRPRMPGKDVRLAVEHVRVGVPALRDQPDVLGHVGVRRTGPLAVDDLVVVAGIATLVGCTRNLSQGGATGSLEGGKAGRKSGKLVGTGGRGEERVSIQKEMGDLSRGASGEIQGARGEIHG